MSPLLPERIPSVCLAWGLVGCVLVNGWTSTPKSQSTVQSLKPTVQDVHVPTEPKPLNPGEKHTYPLVLNANDYLKLVVEQKGIDVVVRLIGPDGKKLADVNSPNGTQGAEVVSLIVEQAGNYTVEVASVDKTGKAGNYELKLEALHLATDQDRATVEIEALRAKVEQLRLAGKPNDALPLAIQALEKSEHVFGQEHSLVATSLNHLAEIYRAKGEHARVEPMLLRALAIREKALGPDHRDFAQNLNHLALLYKEKGDYARAEPLYLRSLVIREKALGPDHSDVAQSLGNLATLYREKGDYARAEPLLLRALAIREKALGPDHRDLAVILNSLALLYKEKGDYTRAEPLYLRSLAIREKALGPDHRDIAVSLNNLASLYRDQGDYARAEPLYLRSLAIREKVLGSDHRDVAVSLNNLASLYRDQGDYARAEPLYLRSLAIREKVLGPDHPNVANNLKNLAVLYQAKGDYQKAEPLYLRALAIREKVLGPDHPDVAQSLGNLAGLYWAKGETAQATQYRMRSNDAIERDLMRNLTSGSEHQKALYLKKTADRTDQSISFQVQDASDDTDALQTALTVILRRKGRTLDAMTNAIAVLRSQSDPETQKLLDDYTSIVGQISVQTLKDPDEEKPEEHLVYLKSLETVKDKLENDISQRSREFQVQITPITLEGVQKLIPAGAVLVEYAVYRSVDAQSGKFGTPRYVAYVVKPGSGFRVPGSGKPDQSSEIELKSRNPEPGTLSYVDLGEAEPIDRAVSTLRQVLSNKNKSLVKEVKPAMQAVDKLVMKPVRALIGTTNHLLISPDGALNLIPFAALMDEHGKFLVERYTLTYLTSGRDLLRLGVKLRHEEPTLVLANPDYASGTGPVVAGQSLKPLLPLPATAREGQTIQKLVGDARLVVKTEATEKAIKAVHRPALLHVATHGYFLTDTPRETGSTPAHNVSVKPAGNGDQLRIENPLLRSWLFFAGANHGGGEDNDGIMTALEAAQLDLWGTKLVTLSACETGIGEAKNGDGVYGLRRALVLAGSEAQMMSLWSVSDQATRKLMVDYYTRLKAGEGRSAALRNVQLEMLKDPRRQHPFYWASFIQSGEWANLDGKR